MASYDASMYNSRFLSQGQSMQSMTAFASNDMSGDWGSFVWQLKTVNHRYFESSFRLPDGLQAIEPTLRQIAAKQLIRGKLDAVLKIRLSSSSVPAITVNEGLVEALSQANKRLSDITHQPETLSSEVILKWPGVIQQNDTAVYQSLTDIVSDGFKEVLTQLHDNRLREGQSLQCVLEEKLSTLSKLTSKARTLFEHEQSNFQNKLKTKLSEWAVDVDDARFEQEVVLQLQRMDVFEEIERLQIHIQETTRTLSTGDVMGRRLDFMMQELNREANTLASKSVSAEISQIAVDMKVVVEQMREQIQNVV